MIVSFQAFEAWGREHGIERGEEETPLEYVARCRKLLGKQATVPARVIDAYNRAVYGNSPPNNEDMQNLEKLWQLMVAYNQRAKAPPPAAMASTRETISGSVSSGGA